MLSVFAVRVFLRDKSGLVKLGHTFDGPSWSNPAVMSDQLSKERFVEKGRYQQLDCNVLIHTLNQKTHNIAATLPCHWRHGKQTLLDDLEESR